MGQVHAGAHTWSAGRPVRTPIRAAGASRIAHNGPMLPTLEFSATNDGVDWSALKAALAADRFDNGRTPEEYAASYGRSHAVMFVRHDERFVGSARLLSDGVCNAYLVDVWTASAYRRRGVASEMVRRLLATVPGQHVALFTEDMRPLYEGLGFEVEHGGMSRVVGTWLNRPGPQG